MIVSTVFILFLQIFISTTQDQIRYNPLISAQCKAQCLHEYRNHHQRLLTSSVLTLPWRSIWERCPRLITCSSCLLPCDLDPPLLLSNDQTCQAICSTLRTIECEHSCMFIRNLYREQSNRSDDSHRPYNVVAMERKSRRTVRLKWQSNDVIDTEPVFYVIEAQWILPMSDGNDDELVSKWGFLKEEVSNRKAIIRNIQRDQRWYQFRIAAVTRHGHSAFSKETIPLRLLTNRSHILPSVIDPPRNFDVKGYQLNSNSINITLSWEKPDFPIDGYQLSWELDNDQSLTVHSIDISSLEFTLPFLSIDKNYLFQIRSMIIGDDHHIRMSNPRKRKFHPEEDLYSIRNFQISPAYFHNGLIKTNISWNQIPDDRIKQYEIYWIEQQCHLNISFGCRRRDAVTIQNSFQLDDLRFNCTYLEDIQISAGLKMNRTFQFSFNVTSCEEIDVQGFIQPPCQTDRKTMDILSSIPPLDLIVIRNSSGWILFWQNIQSLSSLMDKIFYRLSIEIISIELPSSTRTYFIPYSKVSTHGYLNVTLSLMDNTTLRQQQSIFISDQRKDSLDIASLSSKINDFQYLNFLVLSISYVVIR